MKYFGNGFNIVIFFLFFLINDLTGQIYTKELEINKTKSSFPNNLEFIKVCQWKNDARTCINFSFDDFCFSQKKISEIFDQYGFKSTYFVNSKYLLVDSFKVMCSKGHEIGNHTYSHPDLTLIDSLQIDDEIRLGKEMIEKAFGIKCVSFAEPFHNKSPLSSKIAFKYSLFIRNYSEYPETKHELLNFLTFSKIVDFTTYLKKSINSGSILEITGHGIDSDGFMPITKGFLIEVLDSVKHYTDRGQVWVTTIKDGVQYENLFHELSLEREQRGDTVILNFRNFKKEKYKDLDASPISIEIPYILSKDLTILTNSVKLRKAIDKYVLTFDLKLDTTLAIVLKGYAERSDSLSKMIYKSNFVYPNPVKDILHLRCVGKILSVEVYNVAGSRQIHLPFNVSKIDVSKFANGTYFIRVVASNGISKTEYNDKFIKIK